MIPSGLILKLVTRVLAISFLVPFRSVPGATVDDPYAAISRDIEREIAAGRADGVAVALTCKGKVIWERGFGWADKEKKIAVTPDTPFSLASVTKSFTTTALMTMVATGKISLDTPANDYLGVAKIWGDAGDPAKVTLRALASHSAGLPGTFVIYPEGGVEKQPSMDEVIRDYAFLVTPPGERFHYSNVGMGIVAHIVARVSGRDFGTYLHDQVLAPLGLSHSFFDTDLSRRGEMAQRYDNTGRAFAFYVTSTPGTGELYASVHDVARFAMFHLKDHLADQKPIITDEEIDQLHQPVIHVLADRSYGLGWMVGRAADGSPVVYHNGESAWRRCRHDAPACARYLLCCADQPRRRRRAARARARRDHSHPHPEVELENSLATGTTTIARQLSRKMAGHTPRQGERDPAYLGHQREELHSPGRKGEA